MLHILQVFFKLIKMVQYHIFVTRAHWVDVRHKVVICLYTARYLIMLRTVGLDCCSLLP
jgi:hypothetical protein